MEPAPVTSQACFFNDNQKSQGHSLKKVGVWLEEPTFTHGQLYVTVLRVADPQYLYFAVNNSGSRKTRNVVYKAII